MHFFRNTFPVCSRVSSWVVCAPEISRQSVAQVSVVQVPGSIPDGSPRPRTPSGLEPVSAGVSGVVLPGHPPADPHVVVDGEEGWNVEVGGGVLLEGELVSMGLNVARDSSVSVLPCDRYGVLKALRGGYRIDAPVPGAVGGVQSVPMR